MKHIRHVSLIIALISIPFTSWAYSGSLGIGTVYENNIRPGWLVYELKPGDTFEDEVLISYISTEAADVKLYAEDRTNKTNENNKNQFIPQWINIEKKSFNLLAGDTREKIKFKIKIPLDAKTGKYEGDIWIHEPPNINDKPRLVNNGNGHIINTKVGRRIGVGIDLTITENPHMPDRFEKNLAVKADSIKYMSIFIISSTIIASLLLIFQEKRKIKKPHA